MTWGSALNTEPYQYQGRFPYNSPTSPAAFAPKKSHDAKAVGTSDNELAVIAGSAISNVLLGVRGAV